MTLPDYSDENGSFRIPESARNGFERSGIFCNEVPAKEIDTYEPITCTACTRVHLVNRSTGRTLPRIRRIISSGRAATRSTGAPYYNDSGPQICLDDTQMKHPVGSDFDTAVTEAGVNPALGSPECAWGPVKS